LAAEIADIRHSPTLPFRIDHPLGVVKSYQVAPTSRKLKGKRIYLLSGPWPEKNMTEAMAMVKFSALGI